MLPVTYHLDDWSLEYRGERRLMRTRLHWDSYWRSRDVEPAAVIAFRWSLLPTEQVFEAGDFNWGMSSFGLAPGSRFDLFLELVIAGERVAGAIPAVECPFDN